MLSTLFHSACVSGLFLPGGNLPGKKHPEWTWPGLVQCCTFRVSESLLRSWWQRDFFAGWRRAIPHQGVMAGEGDWQILTVSSVCFLQTVWSLLNLHPQCSPTQQCDV